MSKNMNFPQFFLQSLGCCQESFCLFQVYSLLGGAFKEDSASAFAIFKFMQSGSSSIAFAYSSSLGLYWQLLIG
jgi:hypothetical protein